MFTFSEANVSVNLMIHSLRLPWHCGTVAKVVRSLFLWFSGLLLAGYLLVFAMKIIIVIIVTKMN